MSGEVVRYYMRWNPINGVTYMAEADGTAATLYVLATDYAALQTAFDRCHAESVERWRELIDAGRALEALQAKLDAVTKDALALQGRAQRVESLLVHCRNDMLDVLASGRPTGSTDELADEIAALTDQGRAGEGRNDG